MGTETVLITAEPMIVPVDIEIQKFPVIPGQKINLPIAISITDTRDTYNN